jgi:hypothetical protein
MGHITRMKRREPPQLDMTLEGEFTSPPAPTLSSRILFWSVVVALIAGGLTFAALALWIAMLVLPIAVGAAIVAYVMFRYKMWRARQPGQTRYQVWTPPPGR